MGPVDDATAVPASPSRWNLVGRAERRAARSGLRVRGRNPLLLLVRVARRFVTVRVTGLAAEMTYFATLSVLPLVTSLGASLGLLQRVVGEDAVRGVEQAVVRSLRLVFSEDLTADVVAPMVQVLLRQERVGFAVGSAALALFLASRVFRAAIRALDDAYQVDDRRSLVAQYGLALGFTVAAVVTVAVLLTTLVVGPLLGVGRRLAEGLGAESAWTVAWVYGRGPVVLLVGVAFLTWLYLTGPNVANTLRETVPGAVVAVGGLAVLTVGFRSYLAVAGPRGPGIRDGSDAVVAAAQFLAAALAVLVYLWLASTLVLLGGVVNAEWALAAPAGRAATGDETPAGGETARAGAAASLDRVTTTSSTPDPGPDYGLADDEAARLLHAVVLEVREGLERGELTRRDALVRLGDGSETVAQRFPDVRDVTVRTQVLEAVNPALVANGEEPLAAFDW